MAEKVEVAVEEDMAEEDMAVAVKVAVKEDMVVAEEAGVTDKET